MGERLSVDALEDLATQFRLAAAREPRSRQWRFGPHRGVVVSLAALAIAAPALAITRPWNPVLSRTGIDGPVSTDPSPVISSARKALGVLRRPQTTEDRQRTAPLVKVIGAGNQVAGVQTEFIRSVADRWALVPAKSVTTGPSSTASDQLCLTDGTSIACGPASSVGTTGITALSATTTETRYAGLVPDGVARVRFTTKTGARETAEVASNFFSLNVSEVAPPRMIDAPPGFEGPSRIPGPPTPVAGTLQWLDRNGRVIGPQQPSR